MEFLDNLTRATITVLTDDQRTRNLVLLDMAPRGCKLLRSYRHLQIHLSDFE